MVLEANPCVGVNQPHPQGRRAEQKEMCTDHQEERGFYEVEIGDCDYQFRGRPNDWSSADVTRARAGRGPSGTAVLGAGRA